MVLRSSCSEEVQTFPQNISTPNSTSPENSGTITETFDAELQRWVSNASMSIDHSSTEVCLWFKLNGSKYPRIQFMARDYLAVMSTSVPSEQAFSQAGTTISKRRACLGDDCITAICELQSWNKLFKNRQN